MNRGNKLSFLGTEHDTSLDVRGGKALASYPWSFYRCTRFHGGGDSRAKSQKRHGWAGGFFTPGGRMTKWVRIDDDIHDHPKTQWLAEDLGIDVDATVGKLVRIFAKVATFRPTGELTGVSYRTLEAWASWTGEPGLWARSFMARFVTGTVITGWMERNGRAIEHQAKDAERKATWRASQKAQEVQRVSEPCPVDSPQDSPQDIQRTILVTNTNTNTKLRTTHLHTARERFIAGLASREARGWTARLAMWEAGSDLASNFRALPEDIEAALGDWELNASGDVNANWIRKHVETAIRKRLGDAASAPATPVPGFSRTNGRVSNAEQGFINASIATRVDLLTGKLKPEGRT